VSHAIKGLESLRHLSLVAVNVLGYGRSHDRLLKHLMDVEASACEHRPDVTIKPIDEFCCI
jgi:hypothetical protein